MRKLTGEAGAVAERPSDTSDGVPLTKDMFPAFTGREDLPKPKFNEQGAPIKRGEARYLVNDNGLVAVFNDGKGVSRQLVRRLTKSDKDRSLRAKLKKLGVPGA